MGPLIGPLMTSDWTSDWTSDGTSDWTSEVPPNALWAGAQKFDDVEPESHAEIFDESGKYIEPIDAVTAASAAAAASAAGRAKAAVTQLRKRFSEFEFGMPRQLYALLESPDRYREAFESGRDDDEEEDEARSEESGEESNQATMVYGDETFSDAVNGSSPSGEAPLNAATSSDRLDVAAQRLPTDDDVSTLSLRSLTGLGFGTTWI